MAQKSRKDQILEAAARVFGRMGFHGARMEDIAAEAGIGKSTLYGYFRSKRELFDSMISTSFDMFLEEMGRALEEVEDAKEKLGSFVFLYHQYIRNYSDFARVVIRSSGEMHEDIVDKMVAFRKKMLNFIAGIVEEGVRQGIFREVDPSCVAMLFTGILKEMGIALYAGIEVDRESLERMLDYFFNGIMAY